LFRGIAHERNQLANLERDSNELSCEVVFLSGRGKVFPYRASEGLEFSFLTEAKIVRLEFELG
jgi:hypothetical protein